MAGTESEQPRTSLRHSTNGGSLTCILVSNYCRCVLDKSLVDPANVLLEDDLPQAVITDLREEYSNALKFSDRDIYHHLRDSQARKDQVGGGRWLARLSECKRKDVKRVLSKEYLLPLREALDNLLPIAGLWPALQIGTFRRLLTLKCPEVGRT